MVRVGSKIILVLMLLLAGHLVGGTIAIAGPRIYTSSRRELRLSPECLRLGRYRTVPCYAIQAPDYNRADHWDWIPPPAQTSNPDSPPSCLNC